MNFPFMNPQITLNANFLWEKPSMACFTCLTTGKVEVPVAVNRLSDVRSALS